VNSDPSLKLVLDTGHEEARVSQVNIVSEGRQNLGCWQKVKSERSGKEIYYVHEGWPINALLGV